MSCVDDFSEVTVLVRPTREFSITMGSRSDSLLLLSMYGVLKFFWSNNATWSSWFRRTQSGRGTILYLQTSCFSRITPVDVGVFCLYKYYSEKIPSLFCPWLWLTQFCASASTKCKSIFFHWRIWITCLFTSIHWFTSCVALLSIVWEADAPFSPTASCHTLTSRLLSLSGFALPHTGLSYVKKFFNSITVLWNVDRVVPSVLHNWFRVRFWFSASHDETFWETLVFGTL